MLVSVSLPSVFRQPTANTTPNYCALSSLCFWALSREGKFIKRLTKARFVLCLPGASVVHRLLTQQCWRHASVPTGLHSSCDRQERQVPCPIKPGPGLSPAGYAGLSWSAGCPPSPQQSIWAKPQLPVPSVDSAWEQEGSVWAAGPLASEYANVLQQPSPAAVQPLLSQCLGLTQKSEACTGPDLQALRVTLDILAPRTCIL